MRYCFLVVLTAVLLIVGCCSEVEPAETQTCTGEEDQIIKVAVVTGGHDFDKEKFLAPAYDAKWADAYNKWPREAAEAVKSLKGK